MRVLVTGAGGYIGRVTAAHLAEHGHRVTGWAGRLPDLAHPLGPAAAIDARPLPHAVVHLAARSTVRESFGDPLGYFDVNTAGTLRLLQALDRHRRRVPFVLASTSAVYASSDLPLVETMAPQPSTPYGASKLAAEDLVRAAAQAGLVGGMVLRLFNVAGAAYGVVDTSRTRIIGNAVRAAAGLIPQVGVNGDGSAVREFTHVLDVAEAIRLALEAAETGRSETLNIGSGVAVSMADVIGAVEAVSGRHVPVEHQPAALEPAALVADPRRAGEVLGWKAEIGLAGIVASVWERREQLH